MKAHIISFALVLALLPLAVASAEDRVATLSPNSNSSVIGAPKFDAQKPSLRLAQCGTYGQSCKLTRDGDSCCSQWLCTGNPPTCQ
jgi:hypothetical protein